MHIKKFNESVRSSSEYTVGELIEELKGYDPDMKVYFTLGGSDNFNPVTYVDTETIYVGDDDDDVYDDEGTEVVIIGELTW